MERHYLVCAAGQSQKSLHVIACRSARNKSVDEAVEVGLASIEIELHYRPKYVIVFSREALHDLASARDENEAVAAREAFEQLGAAQ